MNPRFNFEGQARGLYCSEHKLPGKPIFILANLSIALVAHAYRVAKPRAGPCMLLASDCADLHDMPTVL